MPAAAAPLFRRGWTPPAAARPRAGKTTTGICDAPVPSTTATTHRALSAVWARIGDTAETAIAEPEANHSSLAG